MQKYLIFNNITQNDINQMFEMGCIRKQKFAKNTVILSAGNITKEIGIIKSGSVNIEKIDILGNKSILSNFSAGHTIAEAYAITNEIMMVDVVAAENSELIFLNVQALLSKNNSKYSWYTHILENLIKLSSEKNLVLANRIFCITPKNVRSRLLTYLNEQRIIHNSNEFDIPFNRQQMAEYLNLDRSALSKELSNMQSEGLLNYKKNHFTLYVNKN